MKKLVIENVSKYYDKKAILSKINLSVSQNECLGIMGESGSGKTMFSRLLVGIKPDNANINGNIFFDEKDLLKISEKEWNEYRGKKISYISQNPMVVFNPFQNVESHAVELFQSRLGLSKKECINKMIEEMKKLNLPNPEALMKKYPFQLSGGMLQRIMFSMMIQLEPELLIADEPTSALDYYNTEKVTELLKNLQSQNTSLIVITHDYNLAKELDGKIIIMKNGNLIEKGNTSDMLKNPQSDYGKSLILRKRYTRYKKEGI